MLAQPPTDGCQLHSESFTRLACWHAIQPLMARMNSNHPPSATIRKTAGEGLAPLRDAAPWTRRSLAASRIISVCRCFARSYVLSGPPAILDSLPRLLALARREHRLTSPMRA